MVVSGAMVSVDGDRDSIFSCERSVGGGSEGVAVGDQLDDVRRGVGACANLL